MVRLTVMASERRLRGQQTLSLQESVCYQNEWDSGNCKGQRPGDKKLMKVLGKRGERQENGSGNWFVACCFRQRFGHVASRSVTAQMADFEIRSNTIGLFS